MASITKQTIANLYDQHYSAVYCYLFRRLGEEDTARDLAADVFRRLLQAAQEGSAPINNSRAWLFRTAHNLLIDYYRSQKHRCHLPLEPDLIDNRDDPPRLAEREIQIRRLRAALPLLTADQQQVITLRFLEQLSLEEISAAIGKNVGAVKALQHRGLAALQQLLDEKKELPAWEMQK
jgi:RNA polymerase sigma-70 factor, ECF subfamily